MKKLIVLTITSLLLVTTGLAFAQQQDTERERNRQGHHRGMQASPVIDKLIRAVRRLELSEEQKTEIKAIVETMKADIRPVMAELKASQAQLKTLVNAETFDEEAVAAIAEKEGDLTADRVMISSRALSNILAQLTDEQRAELVAMAAERADKRRNKSAGKGKQKPIEESQTE